MTSKISQYGPDDKMRDLIAHNNLLLMALSRFGISLGFADRTVAEVCADNGVDTPTFLAVANFISGLDYHPYQVKLPSLIGYLKQAHSYFLDFLLPSIRRKLIEALSSTAADDVAFVILKFFDEYVGEVRRHMSYEDRTVFTYVEQLSAGRLSDNFRIAKFLANHKPIAYKLQELKDILICHYTGEGSRADLLNSALYDIITCECDLLTHCRVEDLIFVSAVQELEQSLADATAAEPAPAAEEVASPDQLTEREKHIITYVARGMSNKEIADALCLSVHTVTTHRRNISAKLSIHSSAGLTIYAILHHLIDLSDIASPE